MLPRLAIIVFLALLHSSIMSQTSEERKQEIQKREASKPSKEALERRDRTVKRLQQEGVPTIAHLPVIEDSTKAKARSKEEIAQMPIAVCITALQCDRIYRYHWAVTEAGLKKREASGKLDGGVVQERHYVLNWLIDYMEHKWDEVPTDT